MTVRLSTGVRNNLAQSMGRMFNRGSINIYSGAQPVTADAAPTGTLLGTVTLSSGALTQETRAQGTITITGGSTSVATVTVGGLNIIPDGAVAYNASVNQTASDLCDAINRNGLFEASVASAVVTITARPGVGTAYNSATVTSTGSVTATYGNISGGVAPVNGLFLGVSAGGVISKPAGSVWSFAGLAVGTAGWFRFIGSALDSGALISGAPYLVRLDGSVAVSGGDMNMSNIAVVVSAPNTIDSLSFTMPAQ